MLLADSLALPAREKKQKHKSFFIIPMFFGAR